mmetsp:Transcript_29311/g.33597  ORF Transcript_29311/g.33597 Transcript_29311/m.33597 type:complete len:89 (+) Transcript_29311:188-454(+)
MPVVNINQVEMRTPMSMNLNDYCLSDSNCCQYQLPISALTTQRTCHSDNSSECNHSSDSKINLKLLNDFKYTTRIDATTEGRKQTVYI